MWALIEDNSVTKVYTRPTAITVGFVAATYHTENVLYVEGDKPFPVTAPVTEIGDIKYAIGDLKTPRLGTNYPANIMSMWTVSELEAIGIYSVVEDATNLKSGKYYINGAESFVFASGVVTKSYATATARNLAELKVQRKKNINDKARSLLFDYDWYTLRAADGGTAIPSSVATYKAAVRTKSNDMCTLIDNAANVDALAALYVYNSDDPPTRPLGEWPDEPTV